MTTNHLDNTKKSGLITITHFINPHLFWYKYESSFLNNKPLNKLEADLQEYGSKICKNNEYLMRGYTPAAIGEIVLALNSSWNKWIRCEVEHIGQYEADVIIILWAIDYGIPLQMKTKWLRPLSKELAIIKIDNVFCGGIVDILPAECQYNFEMNQTETVGCQQWSEGACKHFETSINKSANIKYTHCLTFDKTHNFGILEFRSNTNIIFTLEKILLDTNHAIKSKNFLKDIQRVNTIKLSRWQDNRGNTSIFKYDVNQVLPINLNRSLNNIGMVAVKTVPTTTTTAGAAATSITSESIDPINQSSAIIATNSHNINVEDERYIEKVKDWHRRNQLLRKQRNEHVYSSDEDFSDSVSNVKYNHNTNNNDNNNNADNRNRVPKTVSQIEPLPHNNDCVGVHHHKIGINNIIPSNDGRSQTAQHIPKELIACYVENNMITDCNDRADFISLGTNLKIPPLPSIELENEIDDATEQFSNVELVNASPKGSSITEPNENDTQQKQQQQSSPTSEQQNQTHSIISDASTTNNTKSIQGVQSLMISRAKYLLSTLDKSSSLPPPQQQQPSKLIPAGFDRSLLNEFRKENNPELIDDNGKTSTTKTKSNQFKSTSQTNRHNNQNGNGRSMTMNNNNNSNNSYNKNNTNIRNYNRMRPKITTNTGEHTFNTAVDEEVCIQSSIRLHRVLVHGSSKMSKPIDSIANANFTDDIHNELQILRFNQIYRIQSYSWPHLLRGLSIVIVNYVQTGKTLAYLPALCSLIQDKITDEDYIENVGPVAIIICTSASEVEKLSKSCRLLFSSSKQKITIVEAYGQRDSHVIMRNLLNGCEILITTPPCMSRLIDSEIKLISRKRVQHLVIENIDLIWERFHLDIVKITKYFYTHHHHHTGKINVSTTGDAVADPKLIDLKSSIVDDSDPRCMAVNEKDEQQTETSTSISNNNNNCQLIITSRSWKQQLNGFFKLCNEPILIIGAFIEAAVYARSKFSLKLSESTKKLISVQQYLEKINYQRERTIIICNNDDEILKIYDHLQTTGSIFMIKVTSCSTPAEIDIIKEWNNPNGNIEIQQILICSDTVLPDLDVKLIQHIIHYSLPKSWSMFSFRFSSSYHYYDDFVIQQKQQQSTNSIDNRKPPATSLILLDENNNEQLPRLIQFMQQHGCQSIQSEILQLSLRIQKNIEENRKNSIKSFCKYLIEFGKCYNQSVCKLRHILTTADKPIKMRPKSSLPMTKKEQQKSLAAIRMPTNGRVKLTILQIYSPIHYAVRLLEHKPLQKSKWKKCNHSDEYVKFSFDLAKYYSNEENSQCVHYPVAIGDLCTIKNDNIYCRAQVLEIKEQKSTIGITKPFDFVVQLKLIDVGRLIFSKSIELLHLPETYKQLPAQSIDLHIGGIVPQDYEDDWSSKQLHTVKNWFENYVTEKIHIEAKILQSFYDFIIVDSLYLVEKLPSIHSEVNLISIRKELVRKQFAVQNDDGLKLLQKMAGDCGLINDDKDMDEESDAEDEIVGKKNSENDNKSKISNQTTIETTDENLLINSINIIDKQLHSTKIITSSSSGSSSRSAIKSFAPSTDNVREQWASLDCNKLQRILLATFIDPNLCFVNNYESAERLNALYAAIDKYTADPKHLECKLERPTTAMACLVKYENAYNRGKIMEFYCDDTATIKCKIFLCDFGKQIEDINLSDILRIPDYLIEFLPFQAILCNLIGIKPLKGHQEHSTLNLKSFMHERWSESVCDLIYDEILDVATHLYTINICDTSEITSANILEFRSYNSILIDCIHGGRAATADDDDDNDNSKKLMIRNVNEFIVKKEYAEYDENTKHLIFDNVNNLDILKSLNGDNNKSSQSSKLDWDDDDDDGVVNVPGSLIPVAPAPSPLVPLLMQQGHNDKMLLNDEYDINFTQEELAQLLQLPPGLASTLPCIINSKLIENPKELNESAVILQSSGDKIYDITNEKPDDEEKKNLCKIKPLQKKYQRINKSKDVKDGKLLLLSSSPPPPPLIYSGRIPSSVIWQQSEDIICIRISTLDDVLDYALNVTARSVELKFYLNGEKFVLFLNLFGCVQSKYTKHIKCGLTIVIRLWKTLNGYRWPRLVRESDKHHWLKYNLTNLINEQHAEEQNEDRRLYNMNENNENTDDDDDDQDEYDDSNDEDNYNCGKMMTNEDLADWATDDF